MKFKSVNGKKSSETIKEGVEVNFDVERKMLVCICANTQRFHAYINQLEKMKIYFCLVSLGLVIGCCVLLCVFVCALNQHPVTEKSFIQFELNDKNHFKIDIRHRQPTEVIGFYIHRLVVCEWTRNQASK